VLPLGPAQASEVIFIGLYNLPSTHRNLRCALYTLNTSHVSYKWFNDIYSCTDYAIVKLFADDTNLFVSGQSIDEVSAIANICISMLNSWFLANKLSLSLDKTCFSVFSVFGVRDDNTRCKVLN